MPHKLRPVINNSLRATAKTQSAGFIGEKDARLIILSLFIARQIGIGLVDALLFSIFAVPHFQRQSDFVVNGDVGAFATKENLLYKRKVTAANRFFQK